MSRAVNLSEAALSDHFEDLVLVHDLVVVEGVALVVVIKNFILSEKVHVVVFKLKAIEGIKHCSIAYFQLELLADGFYQLRHSFEFLTVGLEVHVFLMLTIKFYDKILNFPLNNVHFAIYFNNYLLTIIYFNICLLFIFSCKLTILKLRQLRYLSIFYLKYIIWRS